MCDICYEQEDNILPCVSEHHICETCLNTYIKTLSAKDLSAGQIKCPGEDCTQTWTYKDLRDHLSEDSENYLFEKMQQALSLKNHNQDKQKSTITSEENIIENIMTLKCPSCSQAFDDFDGCNALFCEGCGTHFCGLCFHVSPNKDTSHSHVIHYCQESNGKLFDKVHWQKVHKERRTRQINDFLHHNSERREILDNLNMVLTEDVVTKSELTQIPIRDGFFNEDIYIDLIVIVSFILLLGVFYGIYLKKINLRDSLNYTFIILTFAFQKTNMNFELLI